MEMLEELEGVDVSEGIPESGVVEVDEPGEAEGEQPEAEAEAQEEEASEEERAADVRTMSKEELAEKYGFDLRNPKHQQALREWMAREKRIADSQKYIEELRGGKEAEAEDLFAELLDVSEEPEVEVKPVKQAAAPGKPAAPESSAKPAAQAPGFQGIFSWQTPNDAYKDLTDAQIAINESIASGRQPDYGRLHQIETELTARRMQVLLPQMLEPLLDQVLGNFKSTHLDPVLPQISSVVESVQFDRARNAAQARILKTKAAPVYEEMMKPTGKHFKVNGESFPDTPFNRIIAANPDIMAIRKENQQATIEAQLVQAMRIFHGQKPKPAEAQKLVQTGQNIQKQKQAEKARQQMNAGGVSRPAGATTGGGSSMRQVSSLSEL